MSSWSQRFDATTGWDSKFSLSGKLLLQNGSKYDPINRNTVILVTFLVVCHYSITDSLEVHHPTCLGPLCSSFRMIYSNLKLIRTLRAALWSFFLQLPLWKPASDQAISDKLPQVTTEVTLSILLNVQLQRPSLEDNCTLLTPSLKWQSLLRWGTASGILCLLTADKLPPELSIQSQSSQTPVASCDGGKLWPAIVRISCLRKGERSREGVSRVEISKRHHWRLWSEEVKRESNHNR